ncbi:MAG: GNAT family N-acetyltransferase, partial [Pseudomonadota bacterium]
MTDLSFSIQTVAECFDEALEFRNRNRPVARDPEYYRWRYLERPCAVPAYTVWVREGEQLLGAATVAPQDFCVNGERSCLGLVGDISVAPDARGKGVGSALLRETRTALPEGVNDVLVLPNAEAEGPLRNAGWTMLSALQRRVKLIRPRAGASLPAALAQRTVAMLGAAGQAAVKALGPGATIRLDLDPGDWLDELWAATPGKGFAAAVRDARFVRWRFALHPLERYRIAGIFRGDVP